MDKVGGKRNYGYGKQLAWAGKQALADYYGSGKFGTRATHEERWQQFVSFLKHEGIKDARHIRLQAIENYATHLRQLVEQEEMKVAYAQNLLSTVNVVMEAMRKDKVLTIKPAQWVGNRSNVRTTVPVTLAPSCTDKPFQRLRLHGQERTLHIAQLTRTFGLRFKEASLLNAKQALRQAEQLGRINITLGTKGGRGKGVDRWVPVNQHQFALLKEAAQLQGKANNLIPPDNTYNQWRDHAYYQWRTANKDTGIKGFHDMRAAYACERYLELTGFPAPVAAGTHQASKALDTQARVILSQELGHNRLDVIAAYIGSGK